MSFSEISSRKLNLEDYKQILNSTDKKKLWTVLESSKGNEMAGWKDFGYYWCSEKGGKVLLKKDVENKYHYKLGCHIVEIMGTRGITIDDLESVVTSKFRGRKDLRRCLAKLKKSDKGGRLSCYSEVELENLKMRLTDKNHKSDWKTIFKEVCRITGDEDVQGSIDELENFQRNQDALSPCEALFDTMHKKAPVLSLLCIHNALTDLRQRSASRCFTRNIATLLHHKLRESVTD